MIDLQSNNKMYKAFISMCGDFKYNNNETDLNYIYCSKYFKMSHRAQM